MKDYRMSLAISPVLEFKGDQTIDVDGHWSCLSFITSMEICRQIGSYMKISG